MNSRYALAACVGLMALCPLQTKGDAQEKPIVQLPQSGVPQSITMEGKFVRASYNNEGYVILGYQLAAPLGGGLVPLAASMFVFVAFARLRSEPAAA